jgi:inosine-uridine nucleoside N-ribohydrolase
MRNIPVVIDTDAGTDDLMAIAYLLAQPEMRIEAITVVHGLAHVAAGARNLRRLLAAVNRDDIPVFEGEAKPLVGSQEFPSEWRKMTDELPGVRLPNCENALPTVGAVEFLCQRIRNPERPVRILALGPLTNLALAFSEVSRPSAIQQIVIMGGAVEVPGNLMDGHNEGVNQVAEWNIYCDPDAALKVFDANFPALLIPLDATNDVPLDRPYVEHFRSQPLTPLGRIVADVLTLALPLIDTGLFFAWDPLAAVAMMEPTVVRTRRGNITVVTKGSGIGQTKLIRWDDTSPLSIATHADALKFTALFDCAFHA